jgi:exonuclease VII small subunit
MVDQIKNTVLHLAASCYTFIAAARGRLNAITSADESTKELAAATK